jgi:FkbM family methyltransferase
VNLLSEDIVEIANCRHGRMAFLRNDNIIGRSLRLYGEWAEAEIELAKVFLRPGDKVLDVGANIGTHSIAYGLLVGEYGEVISCEPHPYMFELLSRNTRENSPSQVKLLNTAVGASSGTLWMDLPAQEATLNFGSLKASEPFPGPQPQQERPQEARIPVARDCLDNLYQGPVRLLKIDVEGSEIHVLQGASQLLSIHRPIVMAESNTTAYSLPVIQSLQSHDYVVYLHYAPSFRPANFRGEQHNIFGPCGEATLVAIPQEQDREEPVSAAWKAMLTPIRDLDALVAAMLQKIQYREYLASAYGFDLAAL